MYWKLDIDAAARIVLLGDPQMEGQDRIDREGLYGWISVKINDLYLRHIVNNIVRFLQPTHIVTTGDLFSSQNLNTEEFKSRVARYNWIFEEVALRNTNGYNTLLINVTGNHDIGYANEVSANKIERFEKSFGPVNWRYYTAGHLLAVVNSMNLDTAKHQELRERTILHVNEIAAECKRFEIENGFRLPVILLTHIPLYKPKGVCFDDPEIWTSSNGIVYKQNVLSQDVTNFLLSELRPKFIFTGHDHYGCFYTHNKDSSEYTVRSVMGDFGGHLLLLEIKNITSLETNNHQSFEQFEYHIYSTSFVSVYFITFMIAVFFLCSLSALTLWLLRNSFLKRNPKKISLD